MKNFSKFKLEYSNFICIFIWNSQKFHGKTIVSIK